MTRPDETIAAARAEDARIQRDCELGAGRLRILSERLAVPTRQARETWFAAWQCVADTAAAGDAENAAEALALAGNVLCVVLEGIAADWLAEARAWLRSARAACDGFANTTVVGLDDGGSFVDWASPEFAGVPRWLADRGEFGDWALAIDRVESLRLLPGLMQPPPFARSREVGFCLDVLALITAGASAGHFRALLEIPGGTGRMAGLTAALAVCFAPPPAGHEFRAVDLPGDAGQREAADSLLRMAIGAYGGCGHIEEFRRTHTAERQMTTSPIRPAGGLTAENQMQFAAEVLAVNPPYAMQLPTEAALAIPAAEPITPDVPPIDDDDQCDDVLNDADGNSPPVIAGQSVAGVPAVLNAEPVRRGQAFAAIAMLSTMGPNVAEIARQVGLSRQVLYRMPAFCTALQHMRAERQRAADRLSGSVHGRDASRTYDPDDE